MLERLGVEWQLLVDKICDYIMPLEMNPLEDDDLEDLG